MNRLADAQPTTNWKTKEMPVRPPSAEQVLEIAGDFGMSLTIEDARSFAGILKGLAESFGRLESYPEPKLPVKYPRTPGYRPSPEEDPMNAWYWKSTVKGADDGPLKGKRIALKDTVCLAGVPMAVGSALLESFVPDIEATVATRILDAGGTILGKAACTDLCLDGHGQDTPRGAKNPWNTEYAAGGSSSGSAVLLVQGEVDMTIGGDQAGSIRIPASWSAVYGLKPTHGLVPFTGVMGNDMTLDTIGPMAASVREVAELLAVIVGPDGYDPRQVDVQVQDYLGSLEEGVAGLKIGVLKEGFGHEKGLLGASDPAVDSKVREAACRFTKLGASVEEVSVPMHSDGIHSEPVTSPMMRWAPIARLAQP